MRASIIDVDEVGNNGAAATQRLNNNNAYDDGYMPAQDVKKKKSRRSIVKVRRKRYRDGSSVVSRERIRTEKSIKEVAATMFNVNI